MKKPQDSEFKGLQLVRLPADQATARMDAMSPQQRVDLVLSAPSGRQRMDLILMASKADALVQSIPPEDLVITIKDIGDQDALPLLELSSDQQFGYLLDLELWVKDGMDLNRLAHWLTLLFECGQARVLGWLRSVDFELLVLIFEKTIYMLEREKLETLPQLLAGRVITPDDTHFLLVKLGADFTLLKRLIDLIYTEDRELFFALAGNLGTSPPAETEELALRWRDARLADRGWPDLDEAEQLYQPAYPDNILSASQHPFGLENPPQYPLQTRHTGRLFSEGMAKLEQESARASVASQLANLINRVIVADGMLPGEMKSLEKAAQRVMGYLEIGLSLLGGQDGASSAHLLSGQPLLQLFQVAYGAIHKRVIRARSLVHSPGGSLVSMLSPPLAERIFALLAARPMFLAPESSAAREFLDPQDLIVLDRNLNLAEASLFLAQALRLKKDILPDPLPPGSHPESIEGLSVNTLLLTAFARHQLGLEPTPVFLPFEYLSDLFAKLPKDKALLNQAIRSWSLSVLNSIPAGLDQLVGELTHLLTDQLLRHEPTILDPRFIEGLWIQKKS